MPQVVDTCDIPLTQQTKHSHRRHFRKGKSFIRQIRESSCLQATDRQMFVLPSERSLKIPFRLLGRGSMPAAPSSELPTLSESRQSYSLGSDARPELNQIKKRRGCHTSAKHPRLSRMPSAVSNTVCPLTIPCTGAPLCHEPEELHDCNHVERSDQFCTDSSNIPAISLRGGGEQQQSTCIWLSRALASVPPPNDIRSAKSFVAQRASRPDRLRESYHVSPVR
jgi:hypothetical protein